MNHFMNIRHLMVLLLFSIYNLPFIKNNIFRNFIKYELNFEIFSSQVYFCFILQLFMQVSVA